jgi:hypothetical protein
VHDEAGVDRQLAITLAHDVSVGVPAQAVVRLEEGDVSGARGHIGGSEAGDS